MSPNNDFALVLSGGGARGAYQAGAVRGLFEICREVGHFYPFRNLIGMSAGAINASYLASEADDLDRATDTMCRMWRQLTTADVFKVDYVTVSRTAFRYFRAVSMGGFIDSLRPTQMGLLNVEPLADLLTDSIRFGRVHQHIMEHTLNSLCVTATDYSTALGVTFFMGNPAIQEWKRVHRLGIRSEIGIDHIMGSAAIPLFFPPWKIGNRHYGDGCLRNTAPLSPARRIGASKLIVLGVKKTRAQTLDDSTIIKPSLGRVLSVIINAIFMDAIEVDIERMQVINESLKLSGNPNLRQIHIFHSQPSIPLSELAEPRVEGLPHLLRFLLASLGSAKESSEILSYLTFDPIYLNTLVDLGYSDIMNQKQNLIQFLRV